MRHTDKHRSVSLVSVLLYCLRNKQASLFVWFEGRASVPRTYLGSNAWRGRASGRGTHGSPSSTSLCARLQTCRCSSKARGFVRRSSSICWQWQ
uniref:Uncharacterized protein n=1 Tax=Zea mays TaxID=4577 RepID=C4IY96_MAIZE|nr:unknown [Zea mays]